MIAGQRAQVRKARKSIASFKLREGMPIGAPRHAARQQDVGVPRPARVDRTAAHRAKDLHLFLCDDIYFMDRKKEQIERYQYDFERDERFHAGARARRRGYRAVRPQHAARRPALCPITRPKSTWRTSKRCAKGCGAATTTKSCCGRRSRRPTPAEPPSCSSASRRRAPAPTNFCIQFGDEQLDRRVARDVRARRRQARRDLPHLRHRAPHRRSAAGCRQHPRAARLGQGRIRADDVHGRGPQRQVARVRAGLGEGDRAPADRIVRGRVPHRGSRGGLRWRTASIRSTRSSRTCGR